MSFAAVSFTCTIPGVGKLTCCEKLVQSTPCTTTRPSEVDSVQKSGRLLGSVTKASQVTFTVAGTVSGVHSKDWMIGALELPPGRCSPSPSPLTVPSQAGSNAQSRTTRRRVRIGPIIANLRPARSPRSPGGGWMCAGAATPQNLWTGVDSLRSKRGPYSS